MTIVYTIPQNGKPNMEHFRWCNSCWIITRTVHCCVNSTPLAYIVFFLPFVCTFEVYCLFLYVLGVFVWSNLPFLVCFVCVCLKFLAFSCMFFVCLFEVSCLFLYVFCVFVWSFLPFLVCFMCVCLKFLPFLVCFMCVCLKFLAFSCMFYVCLFEVSCLFLYVFLCVCLKFLAFSCMFYVCLFEVPCLFLYVLCEFVCRCPRDLICTHQHLFEVIDQIK